jgi:conserved oligomeric Golgi complex subunit 2
LGIQFGGSDDSGSEFDGNDSSLPFPKPLTRSAFIEPSFDPTTFLANLSERYQTLEDLRNELRELSQSLNKELLDLVNENYQDFLSLGSTLNGGEEKVEELRVGLLAFQHDLSAVEDNVEHRRAEVAALIDEKKSTIKQIKVGKSLLEIAERLEDLEANLMIGRTTDEALKGAHSENKCLSDESDDGAEDENMALHRLERCVEQYLILQLQLRRHNRSQSYIHNQSDRISRIRATLEIDLQGALKNCKSVHQEQPAAASRIARHTELLLLVNEPNRVKAAQ